jgi:hypothetical protein
MAANATFALNAGVWFRRARLLIVSPDSPGTACPLSGRNSTYRPVQNSGASSKFAAMINRHWDGIAAYCKPENKVSLGFVEGLNNKIRVIQRRAYGIRDEEYLRLKILTCMLPML